jgi:SNF2 family DNA or RNA helicase
MIEILMHRLKENKINAISLVGDDTVQNRSAKIKQFKTDDNIKVIVISTKCGYAGLNLENANKMYFM